MSAKYMFYLKNHDRGIVITDKDTIDDFNVISKNLSDAISNKKISKFETSTDCLIIKSDEIIAIHVSKDSYDNTRKSPQKKTKHEEIVKRDIVPDLDLNDIIDPEKKEASKIKKSSKTEKIIPPLNNDDLINALKPNNQSIEFDSEDIKINKNKIESDNDESNSYKNDEFEDGDDNDQSDNNSDNID